MEQLERDYLLETLVKACNVTEGNIGITINLKGAVITGNLIGGKEYFESMERQFSKLGNEVGTLLSNTLSDISLGYHDSVRENEPGEKGVPTDYLHLKNAKVVVGSFTIPTNGNYWRVRVSEVDGFSMGSISFHS